MESIIYVPQTTDKATNLWSVDVAADAIGDIAHVVKTLNNLSIANAERIAVQIDWANLNAADAVFSVETKLHADLKFVNEQPDETEANATQVTLVAATGSKIFHLVPANWHSLNLAFDKGAISVGNISVAVSIKF